jgi:hypothetical protein
VTSVLFDGKPLGEPSVEKLLHMADEIDAMAAVAMTQGAKQALERLAARFRIFAANHATASLSEGPVAMAGAPAPSTGLYKLRNVFGVWVGDVAQVQQGELLPSAPHECTWHLTTPAASPP